MVGENEKLFHGRLDAGRVLASKLASYRDRDDVVVLGLPRGGVPVAFEVAQALDAPLDIFMVRKIGVPGHEELAMGAIAEGGFRVINEDVVRTLLIPAPDIERATRREQAELARRAARYRGERAMTELQERIVIVVDDGLATGASMRVAIRAIRSKWPRACVVAVPVAPPDTCEALAQEADEVVCAVTPPMFQSVGAWYERFEQVSDEEVEQLLDQAWQSLESGSNRR